MVRQGQSFFCVDEKKRLTYFRSRRTVVPMSETKPTAPCRPRLSWKREPNETGLARIGQGARGFDLRIGGVSVAEVRPLYHYPKDGGARRLLGYTYSANDRHHGIKIRNTVKTGHCWREIDDAKAACEKYVRECLSVKVAA